MNNDSLIKKIMFFVFVFLGLAFLMTVFYISRNFSFIDTNPLAQILFHVLVQIDGANPTFIKGIIIQIIVLPLIATTIAFIVLFYKNRILIKIQNIKFIAFIKKNLIIISTLFFVLSFCVLSKKLELIDYIKTYSKSSTLYEDEYVDPSVVNYTFPETKRNLIYILLESAETSFYSKDNGGQCEKELIPELHQIANENITFNSKGFYVAPNTGWTIGAMVGQSSGIPLTTPVGENEFVTENKFLPGAYSLGDLLEDNGYNNILLLGSNAVFGGRKFYYEKHGNYTFHDYNWALETGLVSEDEYVWWGYEDFKLFEFAKKDLLELSKKDQPFNYTMLTVDTHNPDGYKCKYCKDEYDVNLANVYACSSRQVYEFVEWCKQQDFYDNTTIVIAGDHCSMSETIKKMLDGSDRTVYFAIINNANKIEIRNNRLYCTYDVYPTIVASLGITIEGDKLGLGTNLFSNVETLCEKYGKDSFFNKVKSNSTYYNNHILYGIK